MEGEVNGTSLLHMIAGGDTTTVVIEAVSDTAAGNLSMVWKQAKIMSLSDRARLVLLQPVAILCLTLSTLSFLANLLSITATLLGPNGLTTHLKLVVSLGASDMLLSVSTVSHILNRVFNTVPSLSTPPEERLAFACASTFHFALNTMAIVISLLNLLVMALDHYVAIMNPLHYPTRLSRTNGTLLICAIWFAAFIGGCSVFFADVSKFRKVSQHLNYCEYVQYSDYHGEYLVFAIAFISFFVISYTYGRIYLEVRRTYRNGSSNRMDYVRNRKALLTTMLIIGTFVFCWLPTCLFQVAILIQVQVDKVTVQRMYATFLRANRYLNALLLLNSLCDPIIYAFRLRDVQQGYRKLFQKCFCYCQKRHNSFRSSMMRQTQTAHLSPMDNPPFSVVPKEEQDAVCNNLGLCCDKDEIDLAEVTPMIYCASKHGKGNSFVCHHGCASQATKKKTVENDSYEAQRKPTHTFCTVCNVRDSCSPQQASQV